MQMTPALHRIHGYQQVRAAYNGRLGEVETRVATVQGGEIFRCDLDLFDAEKDAFPYPAGYFDTVLACEILEHLLHDPMHMLLEIRRVLITGGTLILTTPNIASLASVARLLKATENPQICSKYANPERAFAGAEVPHVREYTPSELAELLRAAGFEISDLSTDAIAGYHSELWVEDFLERNGYPTTLRGEQMYCVARTRASWNVIRCPEFLYER